MGELRRAWFASLLLWACVSGWCIGSEPESEWPRFRGPSGFGISTARQLPTNWGGEQGIDWKVELPGAGSSSPIIKSGHIYLTCYSGYAVPRREKGRLKDLQRHLLALRPEDGTVIWTRDVPAAQPEEANIRDHGYAANSPVADDDRVYAFFGKSGVFAYDHDGNFSWKADVGSGTSGWGTAASLTLDGDLLFVNASVESQSLIALDRRTGRERWRARGIKESWNTPIVVTSRSGRRELIVAVHGRVLAFAPETGKPLWSCKTDITWYMVPSIVAAEGVVYVLGGRSGVASLAIRTGGNGDVTDSHRLWTSRKGSNVSSPVVFNGHLYWIHDQQGIAYCAKVDTGELVYEKRLPRAGQVYSSALLAHNRIYYLTRRGTTFVVAANPEFSQIAKNELSDGTRFDSTPAVMGNRLLIRSNKILYCVRQ